MTLVPESRRSGPQRGLNHVSGLVDAIVGRYNLNSPTAREKLLTGIEQLQRTIEALRPENKPLENNWSGFRFSLQAEVLIEQFSFCRDPNDDGLQIEILRLVAGSLKNIPQELALTPENRHMVISELLLDPATTSEQRFFLRELLIRENVKLQIVKDMLKLAELLETMNKPIQINALIDGGKLEDFSELTEHPQLWKAALENMLFAGHFKFRASNSHVIVEQLNENRATLLNSDSLKDYLLELRQRPDLRPEQVSIVEALITGCPLKFSPTEDQNSGLLDNFDLP